MTGRTKKAFSIGINLAKIGKRELEKELSRVYKMKKIDSRHAKKVLSAVLREAAISGRHFEIFARQEAGRISKKMSPLVKEAAKKAYNKARKAGKRVSRRRKR